MDTPPPRPVPPALLDRDRLPELLALLRDSAPNGDRDGGPDSDSEGLQPALTLDLSGAGRLPTPALQLLLAARRDGVPLRVSGPTPAQSAALRALGLSALVDDLPQGAAA